MKKLKPWLIASSAILLPIVGIYAFLLYEFPYVRLRTRAFFGDTRAMMDLSDLMRHSKWLEIAAEKGNPDAYFSLGNLNQRYPKKALEYYRKGAEIEMKKRDRPPSCLCQLGNAYRYGLYGLEKNEAEAKRLEDIVREIQLELRKKEGW